MRRAGRIAADRVTSQFCMMSTPSVAGRRLTQKAEQRIFHGSVFDGARAKMPSPTQSTIGPPVVLAPASLSPVSRSKC